MSTFDQKLAAQTGQVVSFANNAALALSRQVAERQRQLAQELRAPVIVETPAERAEKKEHPGSAERPENLLSTEPDEDADKGVDGNPTDGHRIDVRI
jgi:hypothetical protein